MSWLVKYKPGLDFYHLGLAILVLGICISAFMVIKTSQKSFKLFARYHTLQIAEQDYYDELGRLQIQESSESSLHELAAKASRELGMFVPGLTERLYLK